MIKSIPALFNSTVKRQLIVGVALVHAVMMTLFIWDLVTRQQQVLMQQQISQAKALANSIATSSAGWLLSRDVIGLQEIIEAQRQYPGLIFAMALDRHGHVLAHTDKERIGSYILDLPEEEQYSLLSATEQLTDIMTPAMLSGAPVGWIRVGIGQAEAQKQLHSIVREGLIYTLAAIAIGIIFAYLISVRLTRKLYCIKGVSDAVSEGDNHSRCTGLGNDEVGQLATNLNNMLDSLQSAQEDLSATLRAIPDLLFELDDKGTFHNVWAPDSLRLPWGSDDPVGKNIAEVFSQETAATMMTELSKTPGKRQRPALVVQLNRGADAGKWYELSAAIKRRSSGAARFLVLARDITDRKEADSALQRSEMFSRSIIENNPECITITQPDGTLNFINPAGYDLFESDDPNDMLGRPWGEHLAPDSRVHFNNALKLVYSGESVQLELQALTRKGNRVRLETHLQPFDLNEGLVKYALGITRDISEQHQLKLINKETQRKLLENTERLTRAQHIARIGNWEMEFETQALIWSDEVYRIFDLDKDQVVPTYQTFLDAIHPDDKARVDEAFSYAVDNGTHYDFVHRLLLQDGTIKYVREIGEVIYADDGKPVTAIGTCQDITSERLQEEQLQRSQKMEAMAN